MPTPHELAPFNKKAKGSTLSSLWMFEIFDLSSRVSPATLQSKLILVLTCNMHFNPLVHFQKLMTTDCRSSGSAPSNTTLTDIVPQT